MAEQKRRPKGGIGITKRGDKYEATFTVPKSQLPAGIDRQRITAWGETEIAATAALIEKLRGTKLAPELPGKTTAADEREVRNWLGPDGEDTLHGSTSPNGPVVSGPTLSKAVVCFDMTSFHGRPVWTYPPTSTFPRGYAG